MARGFLLGLWFDCSIKLNINNLFPLRIIITRLFQFLCSALVYLFILIYNFTVQCFFFSLRLDFILTCSLSFPSAGEIDRCLKKVGEGVEQFEDIWQKVSKGRCRDPVGVCPKLLLSGALFYRFYQAFSSFSPNENRYFKDPHALSDPLLSPSAASQCSKHKPEGEI